jgi:hypothetical protein
MLEMATVRISKELIEQGRIIPILERAGYIFFDEKYIGGSDRAFEYTVLGPDVPEDNTLIVFYFTEYPGGEIIISASK